MVVCSNMVSITRRLIPKSEPDYRALPRDCSKVLDLDIKSINFVIASPQADLDVTVYMELPAGMELVGHGQYISKYLLKLKKSLYGLKQVSLNWQQKLLTAFTDRVFVES